LSRVSLFIPVYNELLHTMQCLESILRLPDQAGELIVVATGSSDGTTEYLEAIDGAAVIRSEPDLGCAKTWPQGPLARTAGARMWTSSGGHNGPRSPLG